MEFNDFCNEIRDNIGEYLLGYDFDNIQLQEVTHNNNTTHTGLLISRSEVNVAPTIYMEQYYKQYQDTGDMDAVIKEIAETYKASLESTNDLQTEIFNQKEQYFSNCYLKVVNYEKNKEMLKDVPYKKFMDLAVTIRMLVRVDETGMASAIVTHDHTARLGINEKDLYAAALKNTEFLFPVRINLCRKNSRTQEFTSYPIFLGLLEQQLSCMRRIRLRSLLENWNVDSISCRQVPMKCCSARIMMKWIRRCCSVQRWRLTSLL